MKKFIKLSVVVAMLASLGGCFWGWEGEGRGGRGGGGGHEGHDRGGEHDRGGGGHDDHR